MRIVLHLEKFYFILFFKNLTENSHFIKKQRGDKIELIFIFALAFKIDFFCLNKGSFFDSKALKMQNRRIENIK